MIRLRDYTPARVELGRAGHSVPTRELLDFQLAHARARDAVHHPLDAAAVSLDLKQRNVEHAIVASAAPDRATYLRRPDLGRRVNPESRERLRAMHGDYDAVFVIADGLSALAIHRHAVAVLTLVIDDMRDLQLAPTIVAQQARVAIGDEIGELLGARMAVVLIGERPGLSSPDSLGIYLTWQPRIGRTDAERNCISNIRPEGLSYAAAAQTVVFLMTESRQRKLSGVSLRLP